MRARRGGPGALRAQVDELRARRLRASVTRVVTEVLGLEPQDPGPLAASARRIVLPVVDAAGRPHVAKATSGRHLSREHDRHRWATANGVPVPRLVHFARGTPQVMVTERICGPSLDDVAAPAAWRAAGHLLRQLHDLPPPGDLSVPLASRWAAEVDAEAEAALRSGLLGPDVVDRVRALVERAAHTRHVAGVERVCHGDCMPKHIVFDAHRRPHLIDLEWLRVDDPAWDLGVLCAFHPDRLPDVLDGYAAEPAERERLERAVPGRSLERLVRAVNWTAANGFDVARCRVQLLRHLEAC